MIRRSGTISEGFAKSLDKLAASTPDVENFVQDGEIENHIRSGALTKYSDPDNPYFRNPKGLWNIVGTEFLMFYDDASKSKSPSIGYDLYEMNDGRMHFVDGPGTADWVILRAKELTNEYKNATEKTRKKQFRDLAIKSLVEKK